MFPRELYRRISSILCLVGVLHLGSCGINPSDTETLALNPSYESVQNPYPLFPGILPFPGTLPDHAPTEESLAAQLALLPPLPKVHYSWRLPGKMALDENRDLLFQYVRITHGASINAHWIQEAELDRYVEICHEVNQSSPSLRATLAINYMPWHVAFPRESPPTDFGPSHDIELATFRRDMENVRAWIENANRRHGAQVEVGAILFDSERFIVKPDADPDATAWNDAMDTKYNAFYEIAKEIYPGVYVEWYTRGQWGHFTTREQGDGYSLSLYRLPYTDMTNAHFQLVSGRARARGVSDIVGWVALASGYRAWDADIQKWQWTFDWAYAPSISWRMGQMINRWSPSTATEELPWHMVKFVSFYPAPFSTEFADQGQTWSRHFISYVLGANNLPDPNP